MLFSKIIKNFSIILCLFLSFFIVGCASVQMDSEEDDKIAKEFKVPTNNSSGVYLYRDDVVGASLKKSFWVDGVYFGESAPRTYFYFELEPGKHVISTESEFGENHLGINLEPNTLTFINQIIKFGVFVGGSKLKVKDHETGKNELNSCKKATLQKGKRKELDYVKDKFDALYEANYQENVTK